MYRTTASVGDSPRQTYCRLNNRGKGNMTANRSGSLSNLTTPEGNRLPKVSLVIPDLAGAGAERFAVYLANGLANRGCEVDLVALRAAGACLDIVSPKVRVIDLKSPRVLRSILPLARYLRKTKPDALISNLDYMNLGAIWARRFAGVATRVIPVVHITLSQAAANYVGLWRRLVFAAIKQAYRRTNSIVVVSRDTADDLVRTIGVSPNAVRVIYPILTPGITERSQLPVTHPWLAPGQPDVILAVGRLSDQKDHATLIRAFASVRRQRDVRLLILGEGDLREHLESLVRELGLSDSVSMPGYDNNVFACMSRCALFVLSSKYEAMPMVIVEALASGARVVATDCPSGPREILQGGRYGSLVPPGNVATLSKAILDALDAKPFKTPESVFHPYLSETVVDEYVKLIGELTHA
jgi:glycosyltransferase involved in cell wall biosynthesis